MQSRVLGYSPRLVVIGVLFLTGAACAAKYPQVPMDPSSSVALAEERYSTADVEIFLKGPDGKPIDLPAVVTLLRANGQAYDQATAKAGHVVFERVPLSEFTAQVVAPGYQAATKRFDIPTRTDIKVTIELQPLEAEDAASAAGFAALSPKAQKQVNKALDALHGNKPGDALHPLEAAQKIAPSNAEIEYLFGLYSSELKNGTNARAHWSKALELNPKHLGALLSISNDLLQAKKTNEALPFLNRAVEAEPSSWRAHALLAQALTLQHQGDEAMKQAQRAIDLGHERAASVELIVARILADRGDREQAAQTLEAYLKTHPSDSVAVGDLKMLRDPSVSVAAPTAEAAELDAAAADAAALPLASHWRPADVDESIPAVVSGTTCALDDVVSGAGKRLTELVTDVDKFTATESLTHESINKWGLPSSPEKRKFDYLVSINEIRHGYLNVEEYRNNNGGTAADFPEGVATNGLPALVLIFHPYNVPNFDLTCEGLARISTGLAWQVHFRQRPDKPNTIRRYRIGMDGPSYPVAIKGRAWISADTYQIVRLETDLIAPIPQIRLTADHTEVEYGPVQFRSGKVRMWLPQSADIYYDWKGRRIHRRHSFSHYLLFAVDEKQKISAPKVEQSSADTGSSDSKENP